MSVKALVWVALFFCVAEVLGLQSLKSEESSGSTEYYYRFDSPTFEMMRAELRFDQAGRGQFMFRRKADEEEIKLELHLLPTTLQRINTYLTEAQYLTSEENYQGDRDMSHLGVMTFRFRQGAHQRQVSFNYTRHPTMRLLAELLRHIVTQESRIFAIQLARQYAPLDLDKQLATLQREVKNGWVAEPEKLLPLLEELQSDEGVLLIARRRAGDIVRLIKPR
ncbi:MAG: hypothetical protein HY314_05480 [Acidobacteria bacterium]|nr:hypothetical protein [Acidobacteriota bacterium]